MKKVMLLLFIFIGVTIPSLYSLYSASETGEKIVSTMFVVMSILVQTMIITENKQLENFFRILFFDLRKRD